MEINFKWDSFVANMVTSILATMRGSFRAPLLLSKFRIIIIDVVIFFIFFDSSVEED